MGELSKNIGEDGEALVTNFLNIIGWRKSLQGIQLTCLKSKKHGSEDTPKRTHGIDLLFPQKKQLEEFTAEHVIISVKFSRAAYPNNPNAKFRTHFSDLANTIECYKNSEKRKEINDSVFVDASINSECYTGVLFSLTSDKTSDQDLISKISNSRPDNELKFSHIQIIDNKRAAFIYDSIKTSKELFPSLDVLFNYGLFSENFTDRTIPPFGSIMPSEYLSSPIIPLRVNDKDGKNFAFIISCDEDFSKIALQRLISFARDITQGFSVKLIFLFHSYNESSDASIVTEAALSSQNQLNGQDIKVHSINRDFRSLIHEG